MAQEHKSLMPYAKKQEAYVLTYELTETLDAQQVRELSKELGVSIYDVFVSVRTENDSEIVDVPGFVTDFIYESRALLTFSFTVA